MTPHMRLWFSFALLQRADGQGCSGQCPPVDMSGTAIPSLCPGDNATGAARIPLQVCHPPGSSVELSSLISTQAPQGPARLVVISNYYIGCNAGRREANIYSYASTQIHSQFPNVIFLSSLKGGSADQCQMWAKDYQQNGAIAMAPKSADVVQPSTIHDDASVLRDSFFTSPYPHPSYVIIDYKGIVREKFVGPCCGRQDYFDCSNQDALALNNTLHSLIAPLLLEIEGLYGGTADCFFAAWTDWSDCSCSSSMGTRSRKRTLEQKAMGAGACAAAAEQASCRCNDNTPCSYESWSPWSSCSHFCGSGKQHRIRKARNASAQACPDLEEFQTCQGPPCQSQCVPELGIAFSTQVIANASDGLNSPRDIAFSPHPGRHLGQFSSGREFSTAGEEAWVVNGGSHSITIVTGIGDKPGSLTRFDRGWYHYMINVTALSFNTQSQSGRDPDKDTYGFFATCQDNNNTYIGRKEPNFFQGPTLYSSSPSYKNLVRHDGGECGPADECFFLHSDMLHESPSCPGIVHDPETTTAYGSVFWAIDGVVGHVVRYDFQQPHGPGLMDHSIASVRRYVEVGISRGLPGIHLGMVVDMQNRHLYIAAAGSGEVVQVEMDSGRYVRTAREEFPIFSSSLPSFEYSIWGCVKHKIFARGLNVPSGLALASSRLFVAEYATGHVVVFDLATGFQVNRQAATQPGLMGLSFSRDGRQLFGVNALKEELLEFRVAVPCSKPYKPYANTSYGYPDTLPFDPNVTCNSSERLPAASLFSQVHANTGYASNNTAVQNDSLMDQEAAALASRRDCEANSSLNFDSLLLGGWFCHACLPDNCQSRDGGRCLAIQWVGYRCDNELRVNLNASSDLELDAPASVLAADGCLEFEFNRTYRVVVNASGAPIFVSFAGGGPVSTAVEVGVLKLHMVHPLPVALMSPNGWRLPIRVKGQNASSCVPFVMEVDNEKEGCARCTARPCKWVPCTHDKPEVCDATTAV